MDARKVAELFKERQAEWRKKFMQGMVLSDKLDYRDPQNCSEFAQEIYENMRKEEEEHMVKPDYL